MIQYILLSVLIFNIFLDYWILNDYINTILYNDNDVDYPSSKLIFNRFLL